MLLIIERSICRTAPLLARRLCSGAFSHTNKQELLEQGEEHSAAKHSVAEHSLVEHQATTKCLKIAILGNPNAGKSTLVNQLINRNVCATSSKVHTTLCKANAVYTENDTQLVFIDTPGVVSPAEIKRYKLNRSFEKDPEQSLELADVVGIIQDASNLFTNFKINKCLVNVLKELKSEKPIFLVLNKIDLLKNKGILLPLVAQLTKNKDNLTFSEIFMISALSGNGVNDLRNYLLALAKPKTWLFNPTMYTDQAVETMVEQTVRGKFMDSLLNEIPYAIKVKLESIEINNDGGLTASVQVTCPTDRSAKMVVGFKGERVRDVARESEEALRHALRASVCLKLIVNSMKKKKS